MNREINKIIGLFNTYGTLKRKQIVQYTGWSDRKVRNIIKLAMREQLPSVRGETIIYNPSTRKYEFTNDPQKIEMYRKYLTSYINELYKDIRALRRSGVRGQTEISLE